MKKLILTVGLPRSGKSTWAQLQGYPIASPDSIRLALHGQPFIPSAEPIVWAIAKIMVHALFISGADKVILDSTNITVARRDEWMNGDWECWYKLFSASAAECRARASRDHMVDLLPVIDRMDREQERLVHTQSDRLWPS